MPRPARGTTAAVALLIALAGPLLLPGPAGAAPGATSTGPATATAAEAALGRLTLQSPLAGYQAGASNGPLDLAIYTRYAPDPGTAATTFRGWAAQPGFAAWIRTWQDRSGLNQVLELAFRFRSPADARATAAGYDRVLSAGAVPGSTFAVPHLPAARGYLISATDGTQVINQLEAVVMQTGVYATVLETNVASTSSNTDPIASGTVVSLAARQYAALAAAGPEGPVVPPGPGPPLTRAALIIAAAVLLSLLAYGLARRLPVPQRARAGDSRRAQAHRAAAHRTAAHRTPAHRMTPAPRHD